MTTRTFKQLGQAYGKIPATITATINGVIVFSGEIPTADAPLPVLPDPSVTGTELFSWTSTVDFSGSQSFSISVTGSQLLLTQSLADYCVLDNTSEFFNFYSYDHDGVKSTDPFTDVAIDGIVTQKSSDIQLPGQWYWTIPAGSTFTATLNINAGVLPTPPPPNP
jgi:hypothetical protein